MKIVDYVIGIISPNFKKITKRELERRLSGEEHYCSY